MTEQGQRAVFAEKAMKARDKAARIAKDEPNLVRLAYMLADLMHWSENHGESFDEALQMAAVRYEEER